MSRFSQIREAHHNTGTSRPCGEFSFLRRYRRVADYSGWINTWESRQDDMLPISTTVSQFFDSSDCLSLLQTNHHIFTRL